MPVIQVEGLTKYYGKTVGIRGLDLTVEQGGFFGFIGPNGAGKSTTIRLLLGLIAPTEGTARVLGRPIRRTDPALLREIGYLPGEAIFYPRMKVKDVIAFSARLHGRDCTAMAKRLFERLDLDPDKRIESLSLGNRKKVGIVCAMQHDPRLYILDEPTSGLDPLLQKEFFELLHERNRAGATVFLSSHILSEVQRNCTRAAIVRDGRIIAQDTVEALSKTNAKRVTLHGVTAVPNGLAAKSVSAGRNSISFLYQGEIKALLAAVGGLPVEDMTMTDPDLEEIFLHYYHREGTDA